MRSAELPSELAALRSEFDRLTYRFTLAWGGENEAAQRAEQLSAAIQRLEWALARQQRPKVLVMRSGT
ncbi:MAG TPA: hypothetical protein VFW44_12275 [Bryobacteraceae bacterium]|nr:hypothetical protein [Bryobacteraceae bacterium]